MTSSLCHITPLLESTHNSRQFLCAISARSSHTCKYTENISFDIQNVICIKKEISWLVISIAMANFVPFCKKWENGVAKPCFHSNSLPADTSK